MLCAVTVTPIIQGRPIGATELAQIRQLLDQHPDWSRRRVSEQLAQLWNWRNGAGRLKDMAARTLLLKLHERGWIALPPRRCAPCNRMRRKTMPVAVPPDPELALIGSLAALQPLSLMEVSTPAGRTHRPLFEALLHQYHYLSYRSPVGENLQYLVRDQHGRPLACALFGAAAWQCADRDRHIGWDAAARTRHLHLVTNNTRLLLVPWVKVPHLASHLLGRLARRLSRDWQAKYGHPIYLLETFVEQGRFAGTCYRAANWVRVGQTKGRSRQDRSDGRHHQVPVKDIYLYPLHPRFRRGLQGLVPVPTLHPKSSHDSDPDQSQEYPLSPSDERPAAQTSSAAR